jgi:hypothetical protein
MMEANTTTTTECGRIRCVALRYHHVVEESLIHKQASKM